jgi:hypothetical protein
MQWNTSSANSALPSPIINWVDDWQHGLLKKFFIRTIDSLPYKFIKKALSADKAYRYAVLKKFSRGTPVWKAGAAFPDKATPA